MRNDGTEMTLSPAASQYQAMSAADFAQFGVNAIAYVKTVEHDGATAAGIFAANGEPMGIAANREVAFAGLRQNDIEPLSVH